MNLFGLLLAAHLVGDWIVQTDWQAANKVWWPGPTSAPGRILFGDLRATVADRIGLHRRWWHSVRANQAHCLTYHLTMAVFILPFWHTWGTALAFVVSWVSHGFIDRRWPVRWLLRVTGSPAFAEQTWGVIGADQALHVAVLALIAAAGS